MPTEPGKEQSAWGRSKADSLSVYRSIPFQVATVLVPLIFASAAVIFTDPTSSTQTQIAAPVLSGAIGLVLTFLFVWAAQLLAAPYRQRDELRRRFQAAKARPLSLELELRNYHRIGEDLARHIQAQRGYKSSDKNAWDEWTQEVVEYLGANGLEDAARDFIDAPAGARGPGVALANRVAKLKEIVDGLESETD